MAKNINKYTKLKQDITENELFLGLPVRRKAHCFSVLVMLLRHANFKSGECYPRLSTIARPLGLSNVTVYKCINVMIEHGILLKERKPSTNLYRINPEFLYSDIKTVNITTPSDIKTIKGDIKTVKGGIKTVKVLIEHNNEHNIYNTKNYDKIINDILNSNRGNKDTIVYLIAQSIPLPELNNLLLQNIHSYYVRLAIDKHREMLRQKKLLPQDVAQQSISQALKNNGKKRSANYVAKVQYNKRNNLDWQGNPKK